MTDSTLRRAARGRDTPSPPFHHRFAATQQDVDELGHISNIAYVRWVQEAAVAHSSAVGFTPETYLLEQAIFVVRRHEVDYLLPAYAGEQIELVTQVLWWRGAQSERSTRIVRGADGQLLAQALTRWVYVDTRTGKPRRIPRALEAAFYRERE